MLFFLFSFFLGFDIGPFLIKVNNPALIIQAFLGTTITFFCFSLSAIFAPRGQYLHLGGILISILFNILFFSIFLNSNFIFQVNLYVGLALMCGFIVYDTQKIIEEFSIGKKDYVMHAFDLLIDFIGIFRRLLVIFYNSKEEEKKKEKLKNKKE